MNFFKNKILSENQISKTNKNFRIAMELLKKKEYNKALIFFQKAEKELKDQPKIMNNIGVCYSNLKNYSEAINYYQKAIQLDSKYFASIYNLSIAHYYLEQYDAALNSINQAIQLSPKTDSSKEKLILTKGNILFKNGNIQEAVKYFEAFIKTNNSPRIKHKLSEIYFELKQFEEYKKLYISEENKIFTEDEEVIKKLIQIAEEQQNFDLLRELLKKYYQISHNKDWLTGKSNDFYENKDFKFALVYYDVLFSTDETNIINGMKYAELLLNSGYLDKAIEIAYKLFLYLLNQKQVKQSIQIADKMNEWNPSYIKPRLDLIDYFKKGQNWKLAEKEYEAIWNQQKENMKLIKDYLKTLEELSKKDRSYLNKILNVWEEIVAIRPEDPDVLVELGKIYATHMKYQEAIQFFEQALTYKPGLAEAHYQLGLLYLGINQPGRAYSHLLTIRNKGNKYPEIEEIIKEIRASQRNQ